MQSSTYGNTPTAKTLVNLTQDFTRACVLEWLIRWQGTTTCTDASGRPAMLLRLRTLGGYVKRSVPTMSRVIAWLEDNGFIQVTRVRVGRSYRLLVRVLIRLRNVNETSVKREMKRDETLYINTPVYSKLSHDGAAGPEEDLESAGISPVKEEPPKGPPTRKRFKLTDARFPEHGPAGEHQAAARIRRRAEGPLTPTKAAYHWRDALKAYSGASMDIDVKTKRHVKLCLGWMNVRTIGELDTALEHIFGLWYGSRPDKFKNVECLPWVAHRHRAMFAGDKKTTPPEPVQEKADKPEPVEYSFIKPSKFLGLLKANAKAKK